MNRLRVLGAMICFSFIPANAQDPFEIHVYEYEKLKPGQFTLEQHLNYWAAGSKQFDGTVAPTNDQFHMTFELTGGITDHISLGFMQLNAVRPGGDGLEYAGWRVLPHFYAPESWHLPVDLGLVAEFSFVRPVYAADTRHVEIRPIVERKIGDVQFDVNPVFVRALHGPGIRDGWQFEPAARAAYGEKRFVPYIEYYGAVSEHVHQIFPGVDVKLSKSLLWSLGVGAGLTAEGPGLVCKSRLEFEFGRRE